jgi:predicted PurR-regulated permease PerM
MRGTPLLTLVLALALVLMTGWLLAIGQAIILPILLAVIAVYVLTTAAAALGRVPVINRLSSVLLHALVLLAFTAAVIALALVVSVTLDELAAAMPRYQQNLEALAAKAADVVGIESPTWEDIRDTTFGSMNFQAILLRILGGLSSLGLTLFLVVVYAGFLMAERGHFAAKLAAAFPQGDRAELTGRLVREVNRKIGDYLAVKTGINIVLGALSFVILWGMGVDFALFWAVVIGLFNYIPYVGSFLGVFFPVALAMLQFGEIWPVFLIAVALSAAQVLVGNFVEPWLMGNSLNLSPFVILVSLVAWSSIWGLAGAILAVPITAILVIVLSEFPGTRPIAVLLSRDGDIAPARSRG